MVVHFIDNLRAASGGPTTAVIQLARHQAMAGERVRVVCRYAPDGDSDRAAIDEAWRGLAVELVALDKPPGAAKETGGLKDALDGARIACIHGMWDPIVRKAAAAAHAKGVPWLLFSHGMLHPWSLAQRAWRKRAYLAAFPRATRNARRIICLNREEAAHVTRWLRVPSDAIPTGIDIERYGRSPTGAFRRSLPELGESPYVLFLGRLDPIKGIDLLIEAFALAVKRGLPHHLVVAGPDQGALPGLQDLVGTLGTADRVHFCGAIWGQRKLDALVECSLFAHRPRYEGFGIAVAEALASGKPVVTTAKCRIDGAAEARAIDLCADESDAFAKELIRLAEDSGEADRLGLRGRVWARRHLDWENVMTRIRSAESEST